MPPTLRQPRQIVADDRRTPELLDMFDYQLSPPRMADVRLLARIVHRVHQVARHHHVHTKPHLLANPEGSSEHAHIGVYAHQHDVVNPLLHTEIVNLLAAVADAVIALDFERNILSVIAADSRTDNRV